MCTAVQDVATWLPWTASLFQMDIEWPKKRSNNEMDIFAVRVVPYFGLLSTVQCSTQGGTLTTLYKIPVQNRNRYIMINVFHLVRKQTNKIRDASTVWTLITFATEITILLSEGTLYLLWQTFVYVVLCAFRNIQITYPLPQPILVYGWIPLFYVV